MQGINDQNMRSDWQNAANTEKSTSKQSNTSNTSQNRGLPWQWTFQRADAHSKHLYFNMQDKWQLEHAVAQQLLLGYLTKPRNIPSFMIPFQCITLTTENEVSPPGFKARALSKETKSMSQQATGISHHTKRGTKPWRYHQYISWVTELLLKVWILWRVGFFDKQIFFFLITERGRKYILGKQSSF